MTNDDDNPQSDIMQAEISARYRASAVEITPAELDRRILRQASAEVRNSSSFGWTLSWLRPATIVATLGLTVALLLEIGQHELGAPMNAPEMPDQIATLDAESLPVNKRNADGNAFSSAADAAAKQVRDIDAAADVTLKEMPSLENDGASANIVLKDVPPTENVDASANVTLQEMSKSEKVDASENVALKEMSNTARAVATANPASAELASDTATGLPRCSNAQRQNPADWRLCITELRSNGFQDAAELEAEEFQHAFPDYVAQ